MDPDAGRNSFAGGAQDNGISFRDATNVFGTAVRDSNRHVFLDRNDGASTGIGKKNGTAQHIFAAWQVGNLMRFTTPAFNGTAIRPLGLTPNTGFGGFGEFVTNFKLDQDNTEDLYFVNFNRLFRTTSASTVSSNTGWTELLGVSKAVAPDNPNGNQIINIRGMALTRGVYTSNHSLYVGTNHGKLFRLDDPRNAPVNATPVDITPVGLQGNVQDIAVNPNNDNEVLAIVSNYNTISIWWTNNAKSPVLPGAMEKVICPFLRYAVV